MYFFSLCTQLKQQVKPIPNTYVQHLFRLHKQLLSMYKLSIYYFMEQWTDMPWCRFWNRYKEYETKKDHYLKVLFFKVPEIESKNKQIKSSALWDIE